MLAALVAKNALRLTSNGSAVFIRVKSTCIPRHNFFNCSVASRNCSRYQSRSARGSVSNSPSSSNPLNSVTSSNGKLISIGSRI